MACSPFVVNISIDPLLSTHLVRQTVTLSRVLKMTHLGWKRTPGNCGEVQVFEQLRKSVKKLERGDRKLELQQAAVDPVTRGKNAILARS